MLQSKSSRSSFFIASRNWVSPQGLNLMCLTFLRRFLYNDPHHKFYFFFFSILRFCCRLLFISNFVFTALQMDFELFLILIESWNWIEAFSFSTFQHCHFLHLLFTYEGKAWFVVKVLQLNKKQAKWKFLSDENLNCKFLIVINRLETVSDGDWRLTPAFSPPSWS